VFLNLLVFYCKNISSLAIFNFKKWPKTNQEIVLCKTLLVYNVYLIGTQLFQLIKCPDLHFLINFC
jgi:hypothetical protein